MNSVASNPGIASVSQSHAPVTAHPIPCLRCGYDLRGRAEAGRCPECGTPVADSRQPVGVEGKYLLVHDGVILPPRCIKTNEPVPEGEAITRKVMCFSRALRPMVVTGGIVMMLFQLNLLSRWLPVGWTIVALNLAIVLYVATMILHTRVKASYFVAKQYRANWRRLNIVWSICLFAGFAVILSAAWLAIVIFPRQTEFWTTIALNLTIVSLFVHLAGCLIAFYWLSRKYPQVRIEPFRRGLYRLRGCSPAFLASVEAELAKYAAAVVEPPHQK